MANSLNLYAEKVFAEQPVGLWSLDDQADYISLITDTQRQVFDWSPDGASLSNDINFLGAPFSESPVTKIIPVLSGSGYREIKIISDDFLTLGTLNKDLATFSIGSYFYSATPYLDNITIGYEYYDSATQSFVEKYKKYTTSVSNRWFFISETFPDLPESTQARLFIKIGYVYVPGGDEENYVFFQNGLSLGQWAENFHSVSLGVQPINFPADINLDVDQCIAAYSYGLTERLGYYLVNNNSLMAKNAGVPLVFGSQNTTKLLPNNNLPSLIIPGNGLFNDVGKHKEQTLEFWMKANTNTSGIRKLVGPIASDDGIYIDGPFIVLKINDNVASHYVGHWERPMLINLRVGYNFANLVINGEQVLNLEFLTSSLTFPAQYENGKGQDWIGFYAYDDVSPIEIDCVGLYPYQVPLVVSKRRFVYGQGVEFPENINTAYSGTSIYVDYPFADYTNSYTYPDIGRWAQGFTDNIVPEQGSLSTPTYTDPVINLSESNSKDLLLALQEVQNDTDLFFSFKPNGSFDSINGNIFINNFNLLNKETDCFYGIFKRTEVEQNTQTLIRIEDSVNGTHFSIDLVNGEIHYILSTLQEPVYIAYPNYINEMFCVGLKVSDFANYFGGEAASFFGNKSALKIYIGGTKSLTNTFTGRIYKFALCSDRNFQKAKGFFDNRGIPMDYQNVFDLYPEYVDIDGGDPFLLGGYYDADDNFVEVSQSFWEYYVSGGLPSSFVSESLIDHYASYNLVPTTHFNVLGLDINIDGYWEDQIPLSYFGKYVKDSSGESIYDLDFIQFNMDYPEPSVFMEKQEGGSWTYAELFAQYNAPISRTYESLDNQLFTGYDDYSDLANKVAKTYNFDTSGAYVKTYISFQYTEAGANSPESYFSNTVLLGQDAIVKPGSEWINSKYEVVDNTIIYPPAGVDFKKISLVTHIHFNVNGIKYHPVKVRSLQYSSQAFDYSSPNAVGTRFGSDIYPYKKNGFYFDYKTENPYTIYKGSSPHLYLTNHSGIEIKGTYDPLINRGIEIPINKELAGNYKVMAMQSMIRFNGNEFPYAPTQIFEIESKSYTIKFFMVANSPKGNRAKIYAINSATGQIENGITFYWNGRLVKEPVMTIKEWGLLGISFSNVLNFINFKGAIRFNGPIIFNNVSYYQSTNLQEVQRTTNRKWFSVKYSGELELDWEYWADAYIWQGVLVIASTSYYGVNPSDIYKSFTGTNKIIVEDESVLEVNRYEYSLYQGVTWQSTTQNPV